VRRVRVVNATRGRELGDRVILADWVWPRLRGLIARPRIASGEGLMIVPCRLPAGTLAGTGTAPGDRILWEPAARSGQDELERQGRQN
jgi:hypothetical protein